MPGCIDDVATGDVPEDEEEEGRWGGQMEGGALGRTEMVFSFLWASILRARGPRSGPSGGDEMSPPQRNQPTGCGEPMPVT